MSIPARTFAAALLTLVAACETPLQHAQDYDYRQKHPVAVEPRSAALDLASAEDGRLPGFAAEFIRRGRAPLTVEVGAASAMDAPSRALAQALALQLQAEGLKPAELSLRLILNDPATPPGLAHLRFASAVAILPACGDWSEARDNSPAPDYGCSLQRNIGAMVADPRDLLGAEDQTPAEGGRIGEAVDKYRQAKGPWSVPLPVSADTKSATGGQ
jgi:pilus assembly protein CpaD